MRRNTSASTNTLVLGIFLFLIASVGTCLAQDLPPVRGQYTPGFNATNSGVMPEPGLTYANYFLDYSFDQFQTSKGETVLEHGNAAVFVDANVFEWVAKTKILGANYAAVVLLPFSNSSITSVKLGAVGGGGGFADSFYQPLTLGWHLSRADIQVAYAFFAPTGRYTAGASNNTGAGFWTNALTSGDLLSDQEQGHLAFLVSTLRVPYHPGRNQYPSRPDHGPRLFVDADPSAAEGHAYPSAIRPGRLRTVANH